MNELTDVVGEKGGTILVVKHPWKPLFRASAARSTVPIFLLQQPWTPMVVAGDRFSCRFVDHVTIATGVTDASSMSLYLYNKDYIIYKGFGDLCLLFLPQDSKKPHRGQLDFQGDWFGWGWCWIWWQLPFQQGYGNLLPSKISNSMLRQESRGEWCCSNTIIYLLQQLYYQCCVN